MKRLAMLSGLSLLALAAPFAGFAQDQPAASARIVNAVGEEIGRATVTQIPEGLVIAIEADGLTPGPHGVQLHETGACQPDFAAAGAEFAFRGGDEGATAADDPHAGAPLAIVAGENGHLEAAFVRPSAQLLGDAGGLLDDDGAALVIHGAPGAEGEAGRRVACGVIEAAG